ncbi:hypothetical protein GCK72_010169 [Caenorhabditis remanei]|uniref:Protein kinase domain-containing protein n=1 Tax=Caenorhabditis remanei TaxID=31234 RepID=A0A6A5H257_CAERE|nr:hypothetical protein GCK72_010169 [Caenorhabditis remanei]KAF1761910.1 hypothetical protein GCK72_010169 [Caenorhabditis remanei]
MNIAKTDQKKPSTGEFIKKRESSDDLEFSDNNGTQPASDLLTDLNSIGTYADNVSGASEFDKSVDDYIRQILKYHSWYHGMMFSGTFESMLTHEHSFLVRCSISRCSTKNYLYISTKLGRGEISHFLLDYNEEGWGCGKLLGSLPKTAKKRFVHIYQLLDAWSLLIKETIPVPRQQLVIYHSCVTLGNKLGCGAFGEVYKAKYLARGATEPIEVAVKKEVGTSTRSATKLFCHEAEIMGSLRHTNIVCLYGIASLEKPVMLVMELVTGGDLQKYLQQTLHISNKQLILFSLDIASGMAHLASKEFIHRDLAARNCLITKSLQVKISDFGLAHKGKEIRVKKLKKAPIRWLSPETLLKGIFNEKTDVWSYGVVLTELMTRCAADPLSPRTLKECHKWIKESEHPHKIENGEPKELAELVDICCDKKKSEERKSGNSADRKLPNTGLAQKKSKEGKLRSTERKSKTQRRITSLLRRKEKGPLKLPTGMNPNVERPSPPTLLQTPPIMKPP